MSYFRHNRNSSFCFSAMFSAFLLFFMIFAAGCSSSSSSSSSSSTDTNGPITDALWIGFQDGDEAWHQIELPASMVFVPDVDPDGDGRYSLAVVVASAQHQRVSLTTLEATADELSQINFQDFFSETENATLEVTIEEPDMEGSSYVSLYLADQSKERISPFPATLSFDCNEGEYDLIATHLTAFLANYPTHLEAYRDLSLTGDAISQETISHEVFGEGNALSDPYLITVEDDEFNSIDSALYLGNVSLLTANGTKAEVGWKSFGSDPNLSYAALNVLPDDDIYVVELSVEDSVDDDLSIEYYEGFRVAGARTVTIPSMDFEFEFTTETANDVLLPGLTGAAYPTNALGYTTQFWGVANEIEYRTMSHTTVNRLEGEEGDIRFSMPDLQNAPGWDSRWSIPAGTTPEITSVSVQAASEGGTLQNFSNWYTGGLLRITDGEWFASISKTSSNLDPL